MKQENKKKELLILASTFPRWENDTDPPFIFDLCKMIKNKYSIHVLSPHVHGAKSKELFNGIQVERFRYFFTRWQTLTYEGGILNRLKERPWRYALVPFFILGELIALIRLLSGKRFDVINAHWLIPQGLVAVAAKGLLKSSMPPLVCTLHGGDIYALDGYFLNALKRFVLSKSAAIIVVSRAMHNTVLSLGVDSNSVKVIPMGVNLKTQFIPTIAARKEKSLLFVGRFVEKKGLRYLLEALPSIIQNHPEVLLNIVGHGPEEVELKKLVASLNLDSKVRFLGAIENTRLPGIYQSSEIVVFPFIRDTRGDMEGFGLVMVEALGCECAVIASDVPAIHDIIIDKKTGIIVPQKNVQKIAEKINFLLDNPDVQRSLGRQGRRYVLERYDWEITARKYCDLFEELL